MTLEISTPAQRIDVPCTIEMGEARISHVPDGTVLTARDAEYPNVFDGGMQPIAGVGALLVELRDRAMLVDCGIGPHQQQGRGVTSDGGALLQNLAMLGCPPERIDTVMVTHLHPNHIGWLCPAADSAADAPFAHATVYVSASEWENRDAAAAQGVTAEMISQFKSQVRTVLHGDEVFPGSRIQLLPGHTIGHAGLIISSRGKRLIAFGDALHSPLQVAQPQWPLAEDFDHEQAVYIRRRLVADVAESDTIGYGCHFGAEAFGQIAAAADGYMWQSLEQEMPAPRR